MKKGFTLAEILVSMGIIGIVSAMTIPSLVSEHKKQVYCSQLSSTVSNLENAFTSMMATEGTEIFSDTIFRSSGLATEDSTTALAKYYKINNKSSNVSNIYGTQTPFKNTTDSTLTGISANMLYTAKNNTVLAFRTANKEISEETAAENGTVPLSSSLFVTIDVNGKESPNLYGRDVFMFIVGDDGILYPAGGKIFSLLVSGNTNDIYNKNGSSYTCQSKGGLGCAARVIENGYKMDY